MNQSCAVVPVREFATGKMRLRGRLSDEERSTLAKALLKRVVRALESSRIAKIIVVASNPSEAQSILSNISKLTVIAERSHHGGVNDSMRTGIKRASNFGGNELLLLPADLPFITSSKVDEAIELLQKFELLLNPSVKKDGTNLLAMSSSLHFDLHFDDDSFAKHSREALEAHLNFQILDWPEFSNDLDDREDLQRVMTLCKSESFSDFLTRVSENFL